MITFNGVYLGNWFRVNQVRGRGFLPPQQVITKAVPGRPGSYFVRKQLQERVIENDVTVITSSLPDLRKKVRDIGAILHIEKPVPIVYSDEPNKTYYGVVSGDTDLEEIIGIGQGTITFLCPDPHAYGQEKSSSFVSGQAVPNVEGTANTYPRLMASFISAASEFKVTHLQTGKYVRVVRNFTTGDTLGIDFARGLVEVNDARAMTSLDLASDFFVLKPGAQTIQVTPSGVTATIYWIPRWL